MRTSLLGVIVDGTMSLSTGRRARLCGGANRLAACVKIGLRKIPAFTPRLVDTFPAPAR